MQYPLFAQDYEFLSHDSYICATNVITYDKYDLIASIQAGRTKVKGSLKQEHLDSLLDKLRQSRLFSKIEKRQFFY